jgi:ferredoxin
MHSQARVRVCDAVSQSRPGRAVRGRCPAGAVCLSQPREDPYATLGVPAGADEGTIKRAFRAKVKQLHPDVTGASGGEPTLRLVAAYKALLSIRRAPGTAGSRLAAADPFSQPETDATELFVNELRCVGRACSSACVSKLPTVFGWADDTGAARVINQRGAATDYQLRVAVGQCPTECIQIVTSGQLAVLEGLLLQARSDGAPPLDDIGVHLGELLARARYENGRWRPRS